MATLTGENLLNSILDSTGLEINDLIFNTLSAKLQQMIDNGTASNLAVSIAMSGFSTVINDGTEIGDLTDAVETNRALIEAAAEGDVDDIVFPPIYDDDDDDTPGIPGETFIMTAGTDIFTPTSLGDDQTTPNDDTFYGVLGEQEATSGRVTTFNNGDMLDGGDGNDTLILTAEDDYYEDNVVEMSNIENVVVRNFAGTDLDLDATFWTGVDHFAIRNGTDDVYIDNIAEEFSLVTLQNFGKGVSDGEGLYLEVNDDVFTGDADELDIVLDNFGAGAVKVPARTLDDDVLRGNDESIDGEYGYLDIENYSGDDVIEVFNIESTGGSSRGNFLKFYDGHEVATTLNITGDTKLSLNFSNGNDNDVLATVDASGLDADLFLRGMDSMVDLTITGAQGDNDIAGGSYSLGGGEYTSKTITTFAGNDTIRAGYGDVVIDAGDGDNDIRAGNARDVDITTGDGNDDIRANYWEYSTYDNYYDNIATIDAGAGDDIVRYNAFGEGDLIDGGDGYDVLRINEFYDGTSWVHSAVAATAAGDDTYADLFQNFEAIKFCELNGGTVDMAYLDDIQHVKIGRDAFNATILGLSDGATLDYEYENPGSAVTVELTDTDDDESFNLSLASSAYTTGPWLPGYEQLEGGGDDFGTFALDGVETLNIETTYKCRDFDMSDGDLTDGIDPSFIMSTIALDMDALETLNISGTTDLDLSGMSTATQLSLETIDGAAYDNDLILVLSDNEDGVDITLGDGDNIITGGLGEDIITVGDGSNTFIYGNVLQSQGVDVDVITGFDADDVLDFSALSTTPYKGVVAYAGEANGYGAVLTTLDGANSLAVLDTSTSTLYFDVDGSGTLDNLDMAIELTGVTELSEADNFVFV